jgi:signal transduction histidine kinase
MGGTLIQGADEVPPAPADAPTVPPTAAPAGPAGTQSRSGRVPDAITRAGGLLCAAVGLTVIAAWFVRATAILRFGSQNPMSFNTALAFVVTGVALVALARTRPRAALTAGLFDVVLCVVTLAEYALGRGLGIDQLFVKAYLSAPGRLDETGRGYAGRIQAASGHMATVLDDLLDLSQLSTAEMNLQDVDLSAEVTAICGRLRARDPGRRVLVTVQDGVRAIADRPLIRTVLENLLENAWKFTSGRQDAAIEFAATAADDAPLCCYVRDNGAGFDPAYADKLFQPFQRLHAASEYPGTGTGLASVQRIIDRHGGRTWAEGAVGGGATFYFTLNAKDTP